MIPISAGIEPSALSGGKSLPSGLVILGLVDLAIRTGSASCSAGFSCSANSGKDRMLLAIGLHPRGGLDKVSLGAGESIVESTTNQFEEQR